MKIAIIAAAGKQGRMLTKEAISRGHDVTAIVRNKAKIADIDVKVIEKDLFALTYEDLKPFDAIIDAFNTVNPEEHQTSIKHLTDILSGKPNRLMIVGGAGTLYVDKEHSKRIIDDPNFPAAWRPTAESMAKAFDLLKTRNDVRWTFLSPAAFFMADGERTGHYVLGADELILNSQGKSEISYADYAIAMIDEAEKGAYIQKRFTVVSR